MILHCLEDGFRGKSKTLCCGQHGAACVRAKGQQGPSCQKAWRAAFTSTGPRQTVGRASSMEGHVSRAREPLLRWGHATPRVGSPLRPGELPCSPRPNRLELAIKQRPEAECAQAEPAR